MLFDYIELTTTVDLNQVVSPDLLPDIHHLGVFAVPLQKACFPVLTNVMAHTVLPQQPRVRAVTVTVPLPTLRHWTQWPTPHAGFPPARPGPDTFVTGSG